MNIILFFDSKLLFDFWFEFETHSVRLSVNLLLRPSEYQILRNPTNASNVPSPPSSPCRMDVFALIFVLSHSLTLRNKLKQSWVNSYKRLSDVGFEKLAPYWKRKEVQRYDKRFSLSLRCAVMFWFRFLPCCVVETFFLTYRIISLVFWECSFSLDIDRKWPF